jgi:hypothetical protein
MSKKKNSINDSTPQGIALLLKVILKVNLRKREINFLLKKSILKL